MFNKKTLSTFYSYFNKEYLLKINKFNTLFYLNDSQKFKAEFASKYSIWISLIYIVTNGRFIYDFYDSFLTSIFGNIYPINVMFSVFSTIVTFGMIIPLFKTLATVLSQRIELHYKKENEQQFAEIKNSLRKELISLIEKEDFQLATLSLFDNLISEQKEKNSSQDYIIDQYVFLKKTFLMNLHQNDSEITINSFNSIAQSLNNYLVETKRTETEFIKNTIEDDYQEKLNEWKKKNEQDELDNEIEIELGDNLNYKKHL